MSAGGDSPEAIFALEPSEAYSHWRERLVIGWPSRGINWYLRAEKHAFPVIAITEEPIHTRLPAWTEAV